jgi:hypothetical protein
MKAKAGLLLKRHNIDEEILPVKLAKTERIQ